MYVETRRMNFVFKRRYFSGKLLVFWNWMWSSRTGQFRRQQAYTRRPSGKVKKRKGYKKVVLNRKLMNRGRHWRR